LNNIDTAAQAIADGTAIAVSDGSFKDGHRTASFIITTFERSFSIQGDVISPGDSSIQEAYQSELAGLLGTVLLIEAIISYFDLSNSACTIIIACDGLFALLNSFDTSRPITANKNHFDLLWAIRSKLEDSRITWHFRHIKGHQDDTGYLENLDIWAQLNVEMDSAAKQYWAKMAGIQTPIVHQLDEEPFSVWLQGTKLVMNLWEQLYEYIHDQIARNYWIKHGRLTNENVYCVDWEGAGAAVKASSLARRKFIMKHSTGFCGVGKWLVRCKQADSDACPICSQPEDVEHMWRCQGDSVQKVWDDGIWKLLDWLERNNSHAEMKSAILAGLENWRAGFPTNPQDFSSEVCAAIFEQNDIGWQNFFEGRISCE
jgi:hypothetical protein